MKLKWKKIKQIGQGGNGTVYEVADESGMRWSDLGLQFTCKFSVIL